MNYEELAESLRYYATHVPKLSKSFYAHLWQAAHAIEELQAAVSGFEANTDVAFVKENGHEYIRFVPKWISVTERLPQICTNVIVAGRMKYRWEHKYFQFVDKAYFNEGEFFETDNDWDEGQDEFEITHWMPLPEPPKEDEA